MLRSPHSLIRSLTLSLIARLRSAALVPIRHPQLGRPPQPLELIFFFPTSPPSPHRQCAVLAFPNVFPPLQPSLSPTFCFARYNL